MLLRIQYISNSFVLRLISNAIILKQSNSDNKRCDKHISDLEIFVHPNLKSYNFLLYLLWRFFFMNLFIVYWKKSLRDCSILIENFLRIKIRRRYVDVRCYADATKTDVATNIRLILAKLLHKKKKKENTFGTGLWVDETRHRFLIEETLGGGERGWNVYLPRILCAGHLPPGFAGL